MPLEWKLPRNKKKKRGEGKILKKLLQEVILIRKELQTIRESLELKNSNSNQDMEQTIKDTAERIADYINHLDVEC